MTIPILYDLIVIFALSIVVLFVCLRIKIPVVVGFLLTGIVAGPHGFGLIEAVHEVEILAEMGVVLLLFSIGIEFSFKKLMEVKRPVLLGGSLQVVLTVLAVFFIMREHYGAGNGTSLFMGLVVSLSSTAIVLKILQDTAQIEALHGRLSLSVLIFQDLAVVPMMLVIPYLAGGAAQPQEPVWLLGVKILGILALVVILTKWVVPTALFQIAKTRSRELFVMSILLICFGTAWLTNTLGLSLALGAFLAGLIISESEYSHQTLSNILPFRDTFTGLFFVSIGMLFDPMILISHPLNILLATLAIIILKGALVGLIAFILGYPLRTVVMAGLALAQVGEFSFILAVTGLKANLLPQEQYQFLLTVVVMTMGLTPFLITLAPKLADLIQKTPLPSKLKEGLYLSSEMKIPQVNHLTNHLIVVGYGLTGRNLVQSALAAGINHIVIEMNPQTVRMERQNGVPIFFGDAGQGTVLEHAGVEKARVMVIAIPDHASTRSIVSLARKMNPSLHIVARTRFINEMAPLKGLGADDVVPEEFETSVEIFTRVLTEYLVPKNEIERFTEKIRSDGYQVFRSSYLSCGAFTGMDLKKTGLDISSLRLPPESRLAGQSIADLAIRKNYGLTVLAVKRNDQTITNPGADTRLQEDDILVMMGQPGQIRVFESILLK